jgi:hypothetical protein
MNRKVLLVQVDAAAVLSLGLWRLKLLIALLEEKKPRISLVRTGQVKGGHPLMGFHA